MRGCVLIPSSIFLCVCFSFFGPSGRKMHRVVTCFAFLIPFWDLVGNSPYLMDFYLVRWLELAPLVLLAYSARGKMQMSAIVKCVRMRVRRWGWSFEKLAAIECRVSLQSFTDNDIYINICMYICIFLNYSLKEVSI